MTSKEKRKGRKKIAKLSAFSQDGPWGLITAPNPTSSAFHTCILCIHSHMQLSCASLRQHTHALLYKPCPPPPPPKKKISPWLLCALVPMANRHQTQSPSVWTTWGPHSVVFPHGSVRAQVGSSQSRSVLTVQRGKKKKTGSEIFRGVRMCLLVALTVMLDLT